MTARAREITAHHVLHRLYTYTHRHRKKAGGCMGLQISERRSGTKHIPTHLNVDIQYTHISTHTYTSPLDWRWPSKFTAGPWRVYSDASPSIHSRPLTHINSLSLYIHTFIHSRLPENNINGGQPANRSHTQENHPLLQLCCYWCFDYGASLHVQGEHMIFSRQGNLSFSYIYIHIYLSCTNIY